MLIRHTDAHLCRYLTQSCRGVRAELLSAGCSGLLDWSTPTALPTAPPTGESFLEVVWPPTAISIHGFDVNLGSSASPRWYPLDRIEAGDRRRYFGSQGQPDAFRIRSIPKETTPATTALDAGAIEVYPHSALGLLYRVLYLAEYPTLTETPGTQVVNGFDGDWLEWILWNAAVMVAYKDDEDDPGGGALYVKATTERDRIKARIVTNITRLNRAGPIVPFRSGGGSSRAYRTR
jgi:hypothetical protein